MGQFGIGQPVRRKEDVRLLTGKGLYTDDVNFDDQTWGVFVRSPQAHAKIVSIDLDAPRARPRAWSQFTPARTSRPMASAR